MAPLVLVHHKFVPVKSPIGSCTHQARASHGRDWSWPGGPGQHRRCWSLSKMSHLKSVDHWAVRKYFYWTPWQMVENGHSLFSGMYLPVQWDVGDVMGGSICVFVAEGHKYPELKPGNMADKLIQKYTQIEWLKPSHTLKQFQPGLYDLFVTFCKQVNLFLCKATFTLPPIACMCCISIHIYSWTFKGVPIKP